MIEMITCIYIVIEMLILSIGSLAMALSGDFFNLDYVLTKKEDFFGAVFAAQKYVNRVCDFFEINILGKIILHIITSPFLLPFPVVWFLILSIIWILKQICRLFIFVFRKRNNKVSK